MTFAESPVRFLTWQERPSFMCGIIGYIGARDALLSGGFPRVSVMGEFSIQGIGRVRVVSIHLTQRLSQSEIRRQQLKETLDWMNAPPATPQRANPGASSTAARTWS